MSSREGVAAGGTRHGANVGSAQYAPDLVAASLADLPTRLAPREAGPSAPGAAAP
jgi:hypothetical protein